MLLHTIADLDQVFSAPENVAHEFKTIPHGVVEGVRTDGDFTVSRLISTDPRNYLDPRFAPGGHITL